MPLYDFSCTTCNKTFEIIADMTNGPIEFSIPIAQNTISLGIEGTAHTNIEIEILNKDEESYSEEIIEENVINSNNNYTPDDIELLYDLEPETLVEIPNIYEIYKNVLFPNALQIYNGLTGTLAELLAAQIKDTMSTAPQNLKCILVSDIFNITSILTDSEFPDNRFIPISARFSPVLLEWELQLISISTPQIPDFDSDDFDNDDFDT